MSGAHGHVDRSRPGSDLHLLLHISRQFLRSRLDRHLIEGLNWTRQLYRSILAFRQELMTAVSGPSGNVFIPLSTYLWLRFPIARHFEARVHLCIHMVPKAGPGPILHNIDTE